MLKQLENLGVKSTTFSLPTAFKALSLCHRYSLPEHPWDATAKIGCYMTFSEDRSITPWHVDFGSTTVWYMLLYGTKEFYLIEHTEQNRQIFKEFIGRPDHRWDITIQLCIMDTLCSQY